MDLDLERFWAFVRSKKHKPRPVVPKKPSEIWVEAVEHEHGNPCSSRVKVTLTKMSDGYQGELRFEQATRDSFVAGFLIYTSTSPEPLFLGCTPQRVSRGDTLRLTLYISGAITKDQLRARGLNLA